MKNKPKDYQSYASENGQSDLVLFLKSRGYKLLDDWSWELPSPGYEMAFDETEALNYLVLEWGFGR